MFDLIASLLAYFYSIVPNYGVAIVALTLLIMIVFTPLIFRSTRSMMAMRDIQPKVKKLQAKYSDDKEKLNQETMALYQKHGVNPVGGCLPLFFQAPVFLVLFRVVNGLTRREVDTGYAIGNAMTKQGVAIETGNAEIALAIDDPTSGLRNFNPEYLDETSQMSIDLHASNKMTSFGLDLSRSASELITESFTGSIPYLILVVLIGVLSWYQHQQIQGRSSGAEMNPQMQAITKIMPWFLPVFSFTMPAALCVYFVGQSVVRVAQQSYITHKFYGEGSEADSDDDDDDDDDDEELDGSAAAAAPAGGLMGALMGNNKAGSTPQAGARHGARRPVSTASKPRNRVRPPASEIPSKTNAGAKNSSGSSRVTPSKASTKAASNGAADTAGEEGGGLWAKAKRRASDLSANEAPASKRADKTSGTTTKNPSGSPAKKQSKRVTPKGESSRPSGTKRK